MSRQHTPQHLAQPTVDTVARSRRYFGTDGIRGLVGQWPVTPDFMLKLGWAAGKVLTQQGIGKVLIGKDTRISGYMFESVLEAGLSAAGVDTQLLGPMPTPAIAYLTRTLRARAGIVISASHNPYYDNGVKFFAADGTKLPDELELAIEQQVERAMVIVDSAKLGKATRIIDAPGRYIEFCKNTVTADVVLNGLKIVVDCANGAAYQVAPSVFRELGAEVIEMGIDPNGLNINLNCGATFPQQLRARVLAEQADLGIALDGDGDRVMLVDHTGGVLDGDDVLYILVKHHKMQQSIICGAGIVGTLMTNLGLERALRALDFEFVRAPVGDRYIANELMQRKWYWGGEPSGHIICSAITTTGDGIVTALQVLAAMQTQQTRLADLRQGLTKYPQMLVNVNIHDVSCDVIRLPAVQQAVQAAQHLLGVTGRVLLRYSGTEPLLRIMVEGESVTLVEQLANQLATLIQDCIIKY